jgi:hypothetical protein
MQKQGLVNEQLVPAAWRICPSYGQYLFHSLIFHYENGAVKIYSLGRPSTLVLYVNVCRFNISFFNGYTSVPSEGF